MMKLLLSLLLSMQIILSPSTGASHSSVSTPTQEKRLMWGLIDPELSVWFALLPAEDAPEKDAPILWDWSWRGFLAAIFGDSFLKEASYDGAHL